MGVKFTVSTRAIKGGLEALEKRMRLLKLRKAFVKAGSLGKKGARSDGITNPQLASVHEFGTSKVPARPFISPAFHEHRESYMKLLQKGYRDAVTGNSPDAFVRVLRLIGQKMAADIKNKVTVGPSIPPPLAPATIARKRSSRALIDTGQMVRSIDYEVVE